MRLRTRLGGAGPRAAGRRRRVRLRAQVLGQARCTAGSRRAAGVAGGRRLGWFGDSSSLSAVMDEDILESIKMQLKDQLHEASLEREEERKMWEEQTNWDSASFLGGKKREGRRSPFRSLTRKTSSDFSS